MTAEPTTRAYTLKLSGDAVQRHQLWATHLLVNRSVQTWGDWLLTLRGGLPAALADGDPKRRVLLALSWLSVESPKSLAPRKYCIAQGADSAAIRIDKVMAAFQSVLAQKGVANANEWIEACKPALTARIRDDACWINRSAAFFDLQQQYAGLSVEWAATTFFDLLGGEVAYFALPEDDSSQPAEAKDFVQKAGGWLSRNWGAGEKSDAGAIGDSLRRLADAPPGHIVGKTGTQALATLWLVSGGTGSPDPDSQKLFKQLKQTVGWKGRPSKGAIALDNLASEQSVSADLWEQTRKKLLEEASEQAAKAGSATGKPAWMSDWRADMEQRLGLSYRTDKDLIWEFGVMLDHALRRVSAAHTWIKRAEVERQQFNNDAQKIGDIPPAARQWLDKFCNSRTSSSFASDEYLIRRRAIDGWERVVKAWAQLGDEATRQQRIDAAREIQSNLDDNEKFGDIQLFAGFGDDDADEPRPCLADEAAVVVWLTEAGKPDPDILENYSAATVAAHNRRRFKVPAYRHPDPLRHPVFVDYGNSRWGISYSALRESQARAKLKEKLNSAATDSARQKLQEQLQALPELRSVTLDLWTGQQVESVPFRWHGKRLWKDLDLDHFGEPAANTATRADRFGRAVAGQPQAAVSIAEVFGQKDWNGRLQAPRRELDHLADLVYGKRADADFDKLARLTSGSAPHRARKALENLHWFLTTSAKLKPQGPWLDYVARGLPDGVEYRSGRNGPYLNYVVNKDRKGRARLELARLPGLRVLSLDLGHRYAAACTVWETLSTAQMEAACKAAGRPLPQADEPFIHTKQPTEALQKSGRRKGQPVTKTTIYRRIGPNLLPDGTEHPAPWARLDRQFLLKLPGEDHPARFATRTEFADFNRLRLVAGLREDTAQVIENRPDCVNRRVDQLQVDAVRITQLGLRRLGNLARVAYILTAATKPLAGGQSSTPLSREERVDYVLDALVRWQELAQSTEYTNKWAKELWSDQWAKDLWSEWVQGHFGGPQLVDVSGDTPRSERQRRSEDSRNRLRSVAEQLAAPNGAANCELHRLWSTKWQSRSDKWRVQLRWLRRIILPRIGPRPSGTDAEAHVRRRQHARAIRQMGGLSLRRLKTIRDLYQVLKAFHMRPEPDNLRKNVPEPGDDSLLNFGRRILDQLERLREQRIKQLASRIVEAALGVGSENRREHWNGRRRPSQPIADARFAPCHAVVIENLENYRPEDTRLRRENRQLMTWAARNVRKYIVEGCQLNGLHFVEVSPTYTSRQDSRTGAPGVRCEDLPRTAFANAVEVFRGNPPSSPESSTHSHREVSYIVSLLRKAEDKRNRGEPVSAREQVALSLAERIDDVPPHCGVIRLPRNGGEVFVSANPTSPSSQGLQADLNAAANIGLRALGDPDWLGSWWYLLVDAATGIPVTERIQGSTVWTERVTTSVLAHVADGQSGRRRGTKKERTAVYAFSPWHLSWGQIDRDGVWTTTKNYWPEVERRVADLLISRQTEPETPW